MTHTDDCQCIACVVHRDLDVDELIDGLRRQVEGSIGPESVRVEYKLSKGTRTHTVTTTVETKYQ